MYDRLDREWVRCHACGHDCAIPPGALGVCKVRYNEGGTLTRPVGIRRRLQCDPIEKKPFFHAWPGGLAYSFGMLGCDLHCAYCQNWVTSQALRDPAATAPPRDVDPEELAADAVRQGARVVVSTYNEPLITVEWARGRVSRRRARAGLATGFVSNGNGTPQVLDYLDALDRRLQGRSQELQRPSVSQARWSAPANPRHHPSAARRGVWVEIVTLLVPGFNDSDEELTALTDFWRRSRRDIPWHVTAFHQDYRMQDTAATTAAQLRRAAALGQRAGLHHVYAGNLPGQVGDLEDTRCATCSQRTRRALRLSHPGISREIGWHVPVLPDASSGPVGCCDSAVKSPTIRFCPTTAHAGSRPFVFFPDIIETC